MALDDPLTPEQLAEVIARVDGAAEHPETPSYVAGYEAGWADQAMAAELVGTADRSRRHAVLLTLTAEAVGVGLAWLLGSLLAEAARGAL